MQKTHAGAAFISICLNRRTVTSVGEIQFGWESVHMLTGNEHNKTETSEHVRIMLRNVRTVISPTVRLTQRKSVSFSV